MSAPPATTPPWSRFFSLLQKNVLDRQTWATRDELRIAIVTWIERTYHRRRRQAALGRLTPIEYETIMTTPAQSGRVTQLSPDRAADPSPATASEYTTVIEASTTSSRLGQLDNW